EETAIAKLANWAGASPGDLVRFSIVTGENPNFWRMGDAIFNKEMRRGSRFRYCPSCIVNDLKDGDGHPAARPFVRAHWLTKVVTNCSHHRRPLIEVDFPDLLKNDFARFVATNIDAIQAQAADSFVPQSVSVDAYAEDRIKGIYREPYLDRFEAYV